MKICMLNNIKILLSDLDENKIGYCHWKSNERLPEFLQGESDLDLLFKLSDRNAIENIFQSIDAKKFHALPSDKYQNIEDFLGLDYETGRLTHFHVHYGLDIGEKNIKRYSLPWVEEVLTNTIEHETKPVRISSHEHELLLLILRETLRIPPIKIYIRPHRYTISKKSYGEFDWLHHRVDKQAFLSICHKLIDSESSKKIISSIYDEGLSLDKLHLLRKSLKRFRKQYQTKSSLVTNYIILKDLFKAKVRHYLGNIVKQVPNKRINPRGGLIVVFTGSDGAGKSTMVQHISKEFGRKLDTACFYMGKPKPATFSMIFRRAISYMYKMGLTPYFNLFIKKRNLKKAFKLRNKGVLVLLDRMPQADYPGLMDGPLLSSWNASVNPVKRWISKKEKDGLAKLQDSHIDILIKLKVDAKTASKRGKAHYSVVKQKTKILEKVIYPNAEVAYELDSSSYDILEVKREVAKIIWNRMP